MNVKSNPHLTILTIVFGLLFLNFFLEKNEIFYLCLIFSGLGIFSKASSKLIENIWFKISYILSQIVPNLLLSIIFFLILTPLGLLSKLFNAETNFKSNNNKKSNFKSQNKVFDKKGFEKAW